MSKKLAIIGASDFQNPLILKAKQLGFETHVFAWECGDIGERTADYIQLVLPKLIKLLRNANRSALTEFVLSVQTSVI